MATRRKKAAVRGAKAKKPAKGAAAKRKAAPSTPRLTLEPFTLIETTAGKYSLLLTEFDDAAPVFEEAGHEAGGYAWAAVAETLVSDRPELKEGVRLDPEASMFCAYGEDKAALEALGLLMSEAWRDPDTLRKAILSANFDEWD